MSDKEAILADHFEDLDQQHEVAMLGMWAFLVTEVMLFAATFTAYAVYRSKFPDAFVQGSQHLDVWLGAINTAVLIGSSLTMALAVHGAQIGHRNQLVLCLGLTLFLGLVFLGIKAHEYTTEYHEKLIPGLAFDEKPWIEQGTNPAHVKMFFVFYFVMTGLHAVHMTVGIGLLVVMLVLAWRGRFTKEYHTPVELAGLYWHFVDIVWIFLFPLLYLIGHR